MTDLFRHRKHKHSHLVSNANMKIMANANLEVDIVGSFMKSMEMIFKVRKAMKG